MNMNYIKREQKLKLNKNIIYSSNPIINEDDIADFVSTLNVHKQTEYENDKTKNLNLVKEIQLSSLNINDWGISILIPCILRTRNLVILNLSNNNLTNDSAKILSKCIKYLPFLKSINLSNNLIRDEGSIEIIEEFFSQNLNDEENLSIENNVSVDSVFYNKLIMDNSKKDIEYIDNNLYEIDFSDNFLGTKFILKLGASIENNNKKCKLILKNIGINDIGISNLFKKSKNIEILDISENSVTAELFSQYIETFFDTQLNLKELYLSDICCNRDNLNKIEDGNKIFLELIKHLHKAKNLSILCFSNNKINDESFKYFCFFLKNNENNIKEIDLSNNCITNLDYLHECLKNNKTLKVINLSYNSITDVNMKLFCYGTLSTNLNICELSLSYNKLSNESCNYISYALSAQSKIIKNSINTKNFKKKKCSSLYENEEFYQINSQNCESNSYINNFKDICSYTKNSEGNHKLESKGVHTKEHINKIKELKNLIINRHKEENNFFSCIGIFNFNKASDISKNLYLQEKRRNLIYNKNDQFYNCYNFFSYNCFKGLKFLNLSGCLIDNEGISFLINSLKTSFCPLEFLDISCCENLNENIYQTITTLMSNKKSKFLKNESFIFKNLPLTVRGIPPTLIPLNDSEDNTDKDSIESAWWNYKKDG
ncbi:leucine-rich repeat protein, putative [Plasmodium gallinaceum]|uniref:Leucine-rich repeat protein, putative n=1 Tax=Plasmodium gallinaceum TaxID=5849 RepID=A0A1J1GXE8_PLAGA|nr:leucine-rich repeat protein, putative [Plasmodium gallinaceum]CRG97124.1 leucine-rich repeat protein, putative [Plasmodium gallinaceum]